jgi:hypothetical protein
LMAPRDVPDLIDRMCGFRVCWKCAAEVQP